MSSRNKLIIGIVAAVVVVAIVVAVVMTRSSNETTPAADTPVANTNTAGTTTTAPSTDTTVDEGSEATDTEEVVEDTTAADDAAAILRLGRIFVERFGTFSNRNNFENITNLEPFMTVAMQEEQAAFISENQQEGVPEEYYGITTTVLSTKMVEQADAAATVRVSTQRVERTGSQDPNQFTQAMLLTFEKVGDNWKVNSASWE